MSSEVAVVFPVGSNLAERIPDLWCGDYAGEFFRALLCCGFREDARQFADHVRTRSTFRPEAWRDYEGLTESACREKLRGLGPLDGFAFLLPLAIFLFQTSHPEAVAVLDRVDTQEAGNDWAVARLKGIHLHQCRRFVEAIEAFGEGRPVEAFDEASAAAFYWSLKGSGEAARARSFVEQYASLRGGARLSPGMKIEYAKLLRQGGRRHEGLALLSPESYANEDAGIRAQAGQLRATLLRETGEPIKAAEAARGAVADDPEDLNGWASMIRMVFWGESPEAAAAQLRAALKRNGPSATLLQVALKLPFPDDLIGQVVDTASAGRLTLASARLLTELAIWIGRDDLVAWLIDEYAISGPLASLFRSGKLRHSPRIRENWESSIHLVRSPGAEVTVIAIPGLRDAFSGLPPRYLDTFFARRRFNVVYLRDPAKRLFLSGIAGVATDLRGVAAHLAELPEIRDAARLATLGVSAGGFVALRLGLLLEADRCLCFSAPTLLKDTARQTDGPMEAMMAQGAWYLGEVPAAERDVLHAWPTDSAMRATMFYCGGMKSDEAQAKRLVHPPTPEFVAVGESGDHHSLLPAIETGLFECYLDKLAQA